MAVRTGDDGEDTTVSLNGVTHTADGGDPGGEYGQPGTVFTLGGGQHGPDGDDGGRR